MSWWKFWKQKKSSRRTDASLTTDNLPVRDVSLEEMRAAIREFEDNLPKGVNRTVLLKDDQQIDHRLLAPYLRAIPRRPFYMSRETFEVFEEKDKHIPYYLDRVQQAVDWYIQEHRKWPTDSLHSTKINYRLLTNQHYLKETPPFEMYMTHEENLVTHIDPNTPYS